MFNAQANPAKAFDKFSNFHLPTIGSGGRILGDPQNAASHAVWHSELAID